MVLVLLLSLLLLLAMMQMMGRMVRLLVWSRRVRALVMLGILLLLLVLGILLLLLLLLLLRIVCLGHHHSPCCRAVGCDFIRLKVVDGGQIVGVGSWDLAWEGSRPVPDAAGSVSEFVVLGVLLRTPRYAKFDVDVYMRPSPWVLVWRIHDGHCPPVGDHRRKEGEYHGVGGPGEIYSVLRTLCENRGGDRGPGGGPVRGGGFFLALGTLSRLSAVRVDWYCEAHDPKRLGAKQIM